MASLKTVITGFGGTVTKKGQLILQDYQSSDCQNMLPIPMGGIVTRTGSLKDNTTAYGSGSAIMGIFQYRKQSGSSYKLYADDSGQMNSI